jgi:ribosomal-protein-alanine N-acetyltransferase
VLGLYDYRVRVDHTSPQQPIEYRHAQVSDLCELAQLETKIFGNDGYSILSLRQLLDLSPTTSFVAVQSPTQIVGYGLGAIASDGTTAWLLALAVEEAFRGRGIGAALTNRCLHELLETGVQRTRLTVDPDNTLAQHIYASFGFQPIREEADYFGPRTARLVMELVHW